MSIGNYLNKIRNAIYGREVRESIAKGIETAYNDASEKHDNANMEVKLARGANPNLNTRLNKMDEVDKQTTAQLAQKAKQTDLEIEQARIDSLIANAGDTDGNAELLDIRIGFDGVTYPTAGDATRAIGQYMATENEGWVV